MNLRSCPHEKEVRELVARGQWPIAAEPELRDHVAGCRSCRDLVLLATAFQKARNETLATVKLPPPEILLWRAQLRRRNAVVEQLARPLLGAQIFALAITLIVGLGFTAVEAYHGVDWLTSSYWSEWIAQLPQPASLHWDSLRSWMLTDPTWGWAVLVPAAATLALAGGVIFYLATDRR
jgi:hypothetical protein